MTKDYKKEFMNCLQSIEYGRNNYDVFQDFLTLAALSFHNVIAKDEKVEKEYLSIIKQYKNNKKFPELLVITTLALEEKTQDFLGDIFMSAGFGNVRGGQFFTPYHLSKMIAECTFNDDVMKQQIEEKGYFTLSEPCCGAGGMIIAMSEVMRKKGFNPQKQMKFVGIDIDLKCCQMAYIQTSLLGLRGQIYHGNTISMEMWKNFITPMSIIPLVA